MSAKKISKINNSYCPRCGSGEFMSGKEKAPDADETA